MGLEPVTDCLEGRGPRLRRPLPVDRLERRFQRPFPIFHAAVAEDVACSRRQDITAYFFFLRTIQDVGEKGKRGRMATHCFVLALVRAIEVEQGSRRHAERTEQQLCEFQRLTRNSFKSLPRIGYLLYYPHSNHAAVLGNRGSG